MLEWLKRQTWKVCNGRKPFAGSNPALSAKQHVNMKFDVLLFLLVYR